MPILSNVLLDVRDKRLYMTATDLEVSYRGSCEVELEEPGAVTIQARKFYEIAKELPYEEIWVARQENDWVKVISGEAEYNLMGLPAEEFPQVMKYEGEDWISLDGGLLKEMIDKTIYAVSTEETRYNLSGVYFEKVESGEVPALKLVATDGHRLSLIERSLPEVKRMGFDRGVIIPRKGLQELSRLLEHGQVIEVAFGENIAVFKKEESILTMRLIDGEFPDYETVIPKDCKRVLEVDRARFMETLRRMAIMSTDRYRGVRCRISSDKMEVISNNPEIGDAREEIPVSYQGEEMTIAFNPRYFSEALAVMRSKRVFAKMLDESSACTLFGEEDEGYSAVIMPMRL